MLIFIRIWSNFDIFLDEVQCIFHKRKLNKIKQKPVVFNIFWGIGLDGNMSKSNKKCVQRRLRWRRRSYIDVGIDFEAKNGPKIIPKSIQNRFQNSIASEIVGDKRFKLANCELRDRRRRGNRVLGLPGAATVKDIEYYRIQRTGWVVWHAMGQRLGEFLHCGTPFQVK